MSTQSICFHVAIRKISVLFIWKKAPYLELFDIFYLKPSMRLHCTLAGMTLPSTEFLFSSLYLGSNI